MKPDGYPDALPPSKPVIGLTGGIGSGKSLVARQLRLLGCAVICADELARQALEEPAVQQALTRRLGPAIIDKDGRIDRHRLAEIVFSDPRCLHDLEQIVHPVVRQGRQQLRQKYQKDADVVAIVEDCPLLLEKGIDAECDAVIFVDASRETRLRRLAASRRWDEKELSRREKCQTGLDIKRRQADYIIGNETGENDCLRHVRHILSQILKAHPKTSGGSGATPPPLEKDEA